MMVANYDSAKAVIIPVIGVLLIPLLKWYWGLRKVTW